MVTGTPRAAPHGVGHAALELILPARCAGCGARGTACCPRCRRVFGSPSPQHPPLVPPAIAVYTLTRYAGIGRELVLAYKERGRRDLAEPLGAELAEVLPYLPSARPDSGGTFWLVPAPSRRPAARARGGSHTHMLARHCAALLARAGRRGAVAPALRLRHGARDAVGLDSRQRSDNLAGRMTVVPDGLPPRDTPVVVLDDVVTTGATAAACARALDDANCAVTAVLSLTSAC